MRTGGKGEERMDERGGTGKAMDVQAVLKSMEMEWGKVKDQEMESIKKQTVLKSMEMEWGKVKDHEMESIKKEVMDKVDEVMEEVIEENLVDSGTKPGTGLDNIVLSTYTVKKSSSRSEALMAFHERKRLENLMSKQFNSSGIISKTLSALTPVPSPKPQLDPLSTKSPSPTSMDLPPSTLDPSPTSDMEEEVVMEVSLSPPLWLNSPLSDIDQDEGMEDNDEEVEAIMIKKYAAEEFLHSDSNDNIVRSEFCVDQSPIESAVEDVGLKRKREDEEKEELTKKDAKTEDDMESRLAPTIATSWRQAIGSSEFCIIFIKFCTYI